jgi:aerobic-type carbon monoxide dehydrogenase small subunit (CoxS/CutS family)
MRVLHARLPHAGDRVLEREPDIGDDELLDVIASNLCRCTGYQNIVKAVRAAVREMRGEPQASRNQLCPA